MYGSGMYGLHIELFKMWPEILFIEKKKYDDFKMLDS